MNLMDYDNIMKKYDFIKEEINKGNYSEEVLVRVYLLINNLEFLGKESIRLGQNCGAQIRQLSLQVEWIYMGLMENDKGMVERRKNNFEIYSKQLKMRLEAIL